MSPPPVAGSGAALASQEPAPSPQRAAAWAADLLAGQRESGIAVITVPAPLVALERAFELFAADDPFLWDPPGGIPVCGAGVAAELRASGNRRTRQLELRARDLWQRLSAAVLSPEPAPPPRLYGGLAFAPLGASSPPWDAFGDAHFVLPRWRYAIEGGRAWLSLAIAGPSDAPDRVLWAGRLETVLEALGKNHEAAAPQACRVVHLDEGDRDAWRALIAAITAAIGRGEYEKVVAARKSEVILSAQASPAAVLARLGQTQGDCFRFAFRRGAATFLGATPERLVRRRGDQAATEALAGSTEIGAGATLLASQKERVEQELVVREIERALAPFCAELDVPATPVLRSLRDVVHLHTPICGRLRRPVHVLELVDALHPTPAVGGAPTAAALGWIARHEREPRGWYAAPVGWFDEGGEGEFAVAIRSGLVRGDRVSLFAGAGIVRDSDPEEEFEETRLKQRAVLGALGVAP